MTATLILGVVAWLGQDRLSPHVLEAGEAAPALPAGDATWRIACAAGDDPLAGGEIGTWWAGLESIDAVEATDAVARCYQARWTGTLAPIPGGEDEARQAPADATPDTVPLIPPEAFSSWSATPADSWSFVDSASALRGDIVRAERVALPLTLIVLLVVTRSLRRAAIPLLTGSVVAICGTGLLIGLTHVLSVPALVPTFVTMLSLALGMDYALLWIAQGHPPQPGNGWGRGHGVATTIRLAGTVVIGASLGLLAMPLDVFRVVLVATAIVVLVAVLAATTLVPALIGDRGGEPELAKTGARKIPRKLGMTALLAACALAVLAALGWQATGLRTGISVQLVPQAGSAGTYDAYLQQSLVEVQLSSVDIAFPTAASAGALPGIMGFIGQDEDFAPVVLVDSPDGTTVRSVRAVVVRPVGSGEAVQAVERLRAHVGLESGPVVGGPLVTYERVVNAIAERQVAAGTISLVVAGAVMIALVGMPVVNLVALVGSVLSFSAAMGVLVLIFQRGMLPAIAGVDQTLFVEAWVPIVVFCVLLGMGIDYHLFVLGGIRDARATGVSGQAAIVGGVRAVRPVIAAAAMAMMLVFGGFVVSESHGLQQLGVGLAAGITLDALIVRLWLIPLVLMTGSTRESQAGRSRGIAGRIGSIVGRPAVQRAQVRTEFPDDDTQGNG